MELLLIIVIAVGLMIGIIYGLRRYQKIELEQNADRYNPLPPLDEDASADLNIGAELSALSNEDNSIEYSGTPNSEAATPITSIQSEPLQETAISTNEQTSESPAKVRITQQKQAEQQTTVSASEDLTTAQDSAPPLANDRANQNITDPSTAMPKIHAEQTPSPAATKVIEAPLSQPATKPQAVEKVLATVLSTPEQEQRSPELSPSPELPNSSELLDSPDPSHSAEPSHSLHQPPATAGKATVERPDTHAEATDKKVSPAQSWQDQVAYLKRHNQLTQALAVCEAEYPLWGAYSQACIVIRALLKEAQDDADNLQPIAEKLYQVATQAELLHEKTPDLPPLSTNQLKKLMLEQLTDFDMPYQKIGYTQLRLLKKTDIKLLTQLWGEPHNHVSPRAHCQAQWQPLIDSL